MMITKQFLSSDVCLACDGCCQFAEEKSEWRAKAGKSEEETIKNNLPSGYSQATDLIVEHGGYLKDEKCHGVFTCTFFNSDDHTCGVYQNRPFECRLYPFVLTRTNGKPSVSVHLSCPYVQKTKGSSQYDEYVTYLKDELFKQESVKELLRLNPFLFGEYAQSRHELELVFHLD